MSKERLYCGNNEQRVFVVLHSYSYMIDNIILLITGTLHHRPISELIPKCHPLGSFEQMEAIHVAATPAELYNAVLVDTPLGMYDHIVRKINDLYTSIIFIHLKWPVFLIAEHGPVTSGLRQRLTCFNTFTLFGIHLLFHCDAGSLCQPARTVGKAKETVYRKLSVGVLFICRAPRSRIKFLSCL